VAANGTVALPGDRSADTVEAVCGHGFDEIEREGCPESRRASVLGPARGLPDDWANATRLPGPLVDVIAGTPEGQARVLEDVEAFGPHRSGLVETHERTGRVSRYVEDPAAYGREWNGTRLDNGTFRIDPAAPNATVRTPAWCDASFCLFTSRLVDVTDAHLVVEHGAKRGDEVHVKRLATHLRVAEANAAHFVVDGNDPRAGETYDVYAKPVEVRAPPEGGRRAPGFDLTTVHGGTVQLADLVGQPVVLEFFATWCPSCKENARHLVDVHERFGANVSIVSIGVDPAESPAAIRDFVRTNGIDWPVAIDEQGEVSTRYSVGQLSTEVLVAPDGTIRHVETGVADHERVVGILERMLEEGEST